MRHLALALTLLAVPAPCAASASPGPPPDERLAGLEVIGEAVVRDLALQVHCDATNLIDDTARCALRARFSLEAIGEVSIHAGPRAPRPDGETSLRAMGQLVRVGEVRVDGEVLGEEPRGLEPGARVEVEIEADRELGRGVEYVGEAPWIVMPMVGRHPLFGQSEGMRRGGDGIGGVLVDGARVRFEGELGVEVEAPGFLHVRVAGHEVDGSRTLDASRPTLSLGIEARPDADPVVQLGGPVVALGATGPFPGSPDDEPRFHLSVGYELGLFEWVLVSAAFETDFDSIAEALVVEAATPQLMVIVPSISGGVGVVARQLGDRDADAALRLRAGVHLFGVGVRADYDYWPTTGDWTVTIAARISL
ncbi:MAG: hypothetical protein H6719_10370 [Sandaracinaceae bacterium]|nr:hypothetical protein [Sandaracinaceae bacterium]